MFRMKNHPLLLIAVFIISASRLVSGQAPLDLVNEIKLPVPPSLGSFGWETPSKEVFTIAVAPDQSLLVLDPDATGNWRLVRVKKWWTHEPVSEVLNISGWSGADKKDYLRMNVELQITPDGRYAVAFAAAAWDGPFFFRPKHYVPRQPDTIITVIDLVSWQIVKSIHTSVMEATEFRGARILNNQWIALQGFYPEPTDNPYEHLYDRGNRLISIPDLKAGSECTSKRPSALLEPNAPASAWIEMLAKLDRQNDDACADVLKVSGLGSVELLESHIYKGFDVEPKDLVLHGNFNSVIAKEEQNKSRLPIERVEGEQFDYYDHWNQAAYEMSAIPSFFESPSHLWYVFDYPVLGIYNADGHTLKEQSDPHLLCNGDKHHGLNQGACNCHLEDVAEKQDTLLTYCRVQRGDFDGGFLSQWLSVTRIDDLSDVGFIDLTKDRSWGTNEALGSAEGRAYILSVALGQTLRVYAIPDQH